MRKVILAVALAVCLPACASMDPDPRRDFVPVVAIVVDSTWSEPHTRTFISVTREVGERTEMYGGGATDSQGRATFEVPPWPVTVTAAGMCYEPESIQVAADVGMDTIRLEFGLRRLPQRLRMSHFTCPPLPSEDAANRPIFERMLGDSAVLAWLRPWIENEGVREVATESLKWGSKIAVGEHQLEVIRPSTQYGAGDFDPEAGWYARVLLSDPLRDGYVASIAIRSHGYLGAVPSERQLRFGVCSLDGRIYVSHGDGLVRPCPAP